VRITTVLKETTERPVAAYDMLPSHAAENLFWVGRYTERILGNARFLRTVMQFLAEGNKLSTEATSMTERNLLVALTKYSYTYPGFAGKGSDEKLANPWAELKEVLLNSKRAGSLTFNFLQFNRAIHEVREHWSTDTWRVLRVMEEEFRQDIALSHQGHIRMLHMLDNVITFIVAFIGLNRESISREQGWILLDLGRKIEQSLLLINMLKVTLTGGYPEQVEYNLQQSVLMSHESLVNYRYKYRMPINNELVLDLMLFDPNNPRSLTYQVDRLKAYLKNLPRVQAGGAPMEYERMILEADTLLKQANNKELSLADDSGLGYRQLDGFLSRMYALLAAIPEVITKTYFKHLEIQHQS
jgi:uncharacterized alpha-E superfamily protein